mmetsp:Transcript_50025/g.131847  ORF Transcript_50025/g.131847 Transcript_50025/m.131847 type:complete len:1098 (+) Transcript_50025:17-3310(+)
MVTGAGGSMEKGSVGTLRRFILRNPTRRGALEKSAAAGKCLNVRGVEFTVDTIEEALRQTAEALDIEKPPCVDGAQAGAQSDTLPTSRPATKTIAPLAMAANGEAHTPPRKVVQTTPQTAEKPAKRQRVDDLGTTEKLHARPADRNSVSPAQPIVVVETDRCDDFRCPFNHLRQPEQDPAELAEAWMAHVCREGVYRAQKDFQHLIAHACRVQPRDSIADLMELPLAPSLVLDPCDVTFRKRWGKFWTVAAATASFDDVVGEIRYACEKSPSMGDPLRHCIFVTSTHVVDGLLERLIQLEEEMAAATHQLKTCSKGSTERAAALREAVDELIVYKKQLETSIHQLELDAAHKSDVMPQIRAEGVKAWARWVSLSSEEYLGEGWLTMVTARLADFCPGVRASALQAVAHALTSLEGEDALALVRNCKSEILERIRDDVAAVRGAAVLAFNYAAEECPDKFTSEDHRSVSCLVWDPCREVQEAAAAVIRQGIISSAQGEAREDPNESKLAVLAAFVEQVPNPDIPALMSVMVPSCFFLRCWSAYLGLVFSAELAVGAVEQSPALLLSMLEAALLAIRKHRKQLDRAAAILFPSVPQLMRVTQADQAAIATVARVCRILGTARPAGVHGVFLASALRAQFVAHHHRGILQDIGEAWAALFPRCPEVPPMYQATLEKVLEEFSQQADPTLPLRRLAALLSPSSAPAPPPGLLDRVLAVLDDVSLDADLDDRATATPVAPDCAQDLACQSASDRLPCPGATCGGTTPHALPILAAVDLAVRLVLRQLSSVAAAAPPIRPEDDSPESDSESDELGGAGQRPGAADAEAAAEARRRTLAALVRLLGACDPVALAAFVAIGALHSSAVVLELEEDRVGGPLRRFVASVCGRRVTGEWRPHSESMVGYFLETMDALHQCDSKVDAAAVVAHGLLVYRCAPGLLSLVDLAVGFLGREQGYRALPAALLLCEKLRDEEPLRLAWALSRGFLALVRNQDASAAPRTDAEFRLADQDGSTSGECRVAVHPVALFSSRVARLAGDGGSEDPVAKAAVAVAEKAPQWVGAIGEWLGALQPRVRASVRAQAYVLDKSAGRDQGAAHGSVGVRS